MKSGDQYAPTEWTLDGRKVILRRLERGDKEAILAFAQSVPAHDLLFLRRDIRQERVVAAWLDQIEDGTINTLIAVDSDDVIRGCAALVHDQLSWSSHVADIRVLVGLESRSMGLGRLLAMHCVDMALADDVKKLTVQMTPEQEGALRMFEELGFRPEALLRDQVRDAQGTLYDLVILALNLDHYSATRTVFGL